MTLIIHRKAKQDSTAQQKGKATQYNSSNALIFQRKMLSLVGFEPMTVCSSGVALTNYNMYMYSPVVRS